MPRTARLDAPDLLQHVIVRGVERCDIFRDDNDRNRFVENLSKLLVQTGTECLAWALMSNHFHLLLRPRDIGLAPFMRRLLTGYAIYFNRRHERSGHLFQNRYKSIVCEEDTYLLELVRYIHLNPVRAGLIDGVAALDDYPWSGHSVILGNTTIDEQAVDQVLSLFGKRQREARAKYRQFVADGVALGRRKELGGGRRLSMKGVLGGGDHDPRILGCDEFIEKLRTRRGLEVHISQPVELDMIISMACNHFGIDEHELRVNSRTARIAAVRSVICYLAVRRGGHSGVEVGRRVNLGRAGVCVAAGRGEKMVMDDPKLLRLIDK